MYWLCGVRIIVVQEKKAHHHDHQAFGALAFIYTYTYMVYV